MLVDKLGICAQNRLVQVLSLLRKRIYFDYVVELQTGGKSGAI